MRFHRLVASLIALLTILFATPVAAHPSYGIVADARGNVYFSDLERIWKLAPDGGVALFRDANGAHVHELALDADGNVVGDEGHYDPATETFSSAIWSRSPAGRERYVLARTAEPPKGRGLLLDRRGNSYVAQWPSNADRRTLLFRRSPDGRVTLLFGDAAAAASFRPALVSSIGGMAFDAADALWFADGRALRRADAAGQVTTVFEGDSATHLRGVTVGRDGRVYAADIGNRILLAVPSSGPPATVYRAAPGWAPSGVATAGGRIFVLEAEQDPEHRSHRVRVVEVRNGEAVLVATPGARAAQSGADDSTGSAPAPSRANVPIAAAVAVLSVVAAFVWRRIRRRV